MSVASLLTSIGSVHAVVPLPKPRPVDAPARQEQEAPAEERGTSEQQPVVAVPPKPEPSPCRLALTEDIAIAPSIPSIHGPGSCGGDDLVRLEAVVVSSTQHVSLTPPAVLRCTMATAIANWVREDAAPLAKGLGSPLIELDNFDSYECRGRNRVKGAQLSEHGKANALDVRSLNLANGTKLSLTDRTLARDVREKVLVSVCARFKTVLGPGSDWYHEDHIHLDLAERRNDYKLCHWGIYDPMPEIAPLMPAERPAEAPPRSTADATGDAKPKPETSTGPADVLPEEETPPPSSPSPSAKSSKRQQTQK
jgi:hypothetical protein